MQSKLSVDTYAARSLDGLKATMDMGHPFYKLSGSMGLIYVEARQRAPLVTICQNCAIFVSNPTKQNNSRLLIFKSGVGLNEPS